MYNTEIAILYTNRSENVYYGRFLFGMITYNQFIHQSSILDPIYPFFTYTKDTNVLRIRLKSSV